MVISPGKSAREVGVRPVWVRRVFSREINVALVDWVSSGGPGVAPPPEVLRSRLFVPLPLAAKMLHS
ncbi:hypothetical protein [Saccharopolyspora rhizosphaerae]|uniref:hypothetical protein n=1 Tax=Saccharopolyspora rhizosphaerae TaxID=2492662 RepID=UPI0018F5343C|nr:hypothetical protein [Saccharopolyspora rhizosphaerae]